MLRVLVRRAQLTQQFDVRVERGEVRCERLVGAARVGAVRVGAVRVGERLKNRNTPARTVLNGRD